MRVKSGQSSTNSKFIWPNYNFISTLNQHGFCLIAVALTEVCKGLFKNGV